MTKEKERLAERKQKHYANPQLVKRHKYIHLTIEGAWVDGMEDETMIYFCSYTGINGLETMEGTDKEVLLEKAKKNIR